MRTMLVGLLVVAGVLVAEAQTRGREVTLRGYVVDATRAARHTRACALDERCAAAGYGIFADGKWVKFDAQGDLLANAAIRASKRERGHYFEVRGSMRGDRFAVVSLKEKTEKK
jgi:hypothetical protein